MLTDTPAIAAVSEMEWNQLCRYAHVHDIERGQTADDCLAECAGTIQVCYIAFQKAGAGRMGLTRTTYAVEEPPEGTLHLTTLSPELRHKLSTPSATPQLLVHVLDPINPTPEEEAAMMPIAEATRYFF